VDKKYNAAIIQITLSLILFRKTLDKKPSMSIFTPIQ
jgi:hypothetical protein